MGTQQEEPAVAEGHNGWGSEQGARLRAERQRVDLSLRELGRQVGVGASFLSGLENGKQRPSVRTLHALCDRLGMTLDAFFTADVPPGGQATDSRDTGPSPAPVHASPLARAGERDALSLDSGVSWEQLANLPGPTNVLHIVYQPGGSSTSDESFTRHAGAECGYVVSGTLHVLLAPGFAGPDVYVLRAGDAISFASSTPHRLENRGDEPVTAVWVVHRSDPDDAP